MRLHLLLLVLPLCACGVEEEPAPSVMSPLPGVTEPVPAAVSPERAGAIAAAREEVEARRGELAEAERSAGEAERALGRARTALAEAEDQLARELGARPPDGELFRAIQHQLLVEPALAHVAIAAEVAEGVVTLRGAAPDGHTAQVAEALARAVPGVVDVRNQIRVSGD